MPWQQVKLKISALIHPIRLINILRFRGPFASGVESAGEFNFGILISCSGNGAVMDQLINTRAYAPLFVERTKNWPNAPEVIIMQIFCALAPWYLH